MENNTRITWVIGDIEGFYIDFNTQTLGYRSKEIHLEFLQCELFKFMLKIPGGYVTSDDVAASSELFSINLSKYISDIKRKCLSLLQTQLVDLDADTIFGQIIEKKTIVGRRGYRLRTELTDIFASDETAEVSDGDSSISDGSAIASTITTVTATSVDGSVAGGADGSVDGSVAVSAVGSASGSAAETQGVDKGQATDVQELLSSTDKPEAVVHNLKWYFENNWLQLFIFIFAIMVIGLICDSMGITTEDAISQVLRLPFAVIFVGLCLVSMLPIIGGKFFDVRVAVKEYAKKNNIDYKDVPKARFHDIAMYEVPRFDNSRHHVFFFSLCNLTGAFTIAAELLYAQTTSGIEEVLTSTHQSMVFFFVTLFACFVAIYNNYSLQTVISPMRNADNYILSRAHAFFNTIWLSLAISLGCFVLYILGSYAFFYGSTSLEISSSFVIMLLSLYCYLWFSSDSPGAEEIDSISKSNFITGVPALAVFSTIFTIVCFKPDLPCFISLFSAVFFLVLWVYYLRKHKKTDTFRMHLFFTSFFSVMSICVIVMILLNLV